MGDRGAGKWGLRYGKQAKGTTKMVKEGDSRMTESVHMYVCVCLLSWDYIYSQ